MKHPTGTDIMRILIELLAEQEGVTVTYEIVKKGEETNEESKQIYSSGGSPVFPVSAFN